MSGQADETTGVVFDIDHFAVHDGPGIRTSVYLKGCPLSCEWCHSPESQSPVPQLLYAPSRCQNCMLCVEACPLGLHWQAEGGHTFVERERCSLCGRCAAICPAEAVFLSGREMTARQAADEALEDAVFYRNSGGGVTVSGGEVLAQPAFARELLRLVKEQGVHTIVETAGAGLEEDLLALAPYTDLFYYDFKLAEPEALRRSTGGDSGVIMANLEALRRETAGIVLRVPLIPAITDTWENLAAAVETARRLEIGQVHLLPYNSAAGAKYQWCGRDYTLPGGENPPEEALLALAGGGVEVRIIR